MMSSRTSSIMTYTRYTVKQTTSVSRTNRIVIGKVSPISSQDTQPCPHPPTLAGIIQFFTVDGNANLTDFDQHVPAGTVINNVCQYPGRTRLVGRSERKCTMGMWDVPAPTCEEVNTKFTIATSPVLPQRALRNGSFAILLSPYTMHITINCQVEGGIPELLALHIPADSPRAEHYADRGGSTNMAGVRISSPRPEDGGTFRCMDRSTGEYHSIHFVFDNQRYALLDTDPCPNYDLVVPSDSNSSSAVASWSPPVLADMTGDIVLIASHKPGARFNLGKTHVVYNASDTYGTVEVCTFTVNVRDTTPPVITGCPMDIIVPTDAGRAMARVSWIEPEASDNSGRVTLVTKTLPGTYFGIGSFSIDYTATDRHGNEAVCSFGIVVEDLEPPQLTCPPDIVVNTSPGQPLAETSWVPPTVTDNSGSIPASLSDPGRSGTFYYGRSSRTYTFQDEAGNIATCNFTIHVKDNEPPTFTYCPGNILRYIETSRENTTSISWYPPTPDDNVGIAWPWSASHRPGSKFGVGEHRVNYTVGDIEGNNSTCSFRVDIIEARCPPERTMIDGITFSWPSTTTSTFAVSVERCPVTTVYGGHPRAVRHCKFHHQHVGMWQRTRIQSCGQDITPLDLKELSMVPITKFNIREVANYVEAVVANETSLESDDIRFLSDTLQHMADVQSPSKQVTTAFVGIVDQVVETNPAPITKVVSGNEISHIVQTLDRQIMESAANDKQLNIATPNVAVRTTIVHPSDVTEGLTFAPVTSFNNEDGDEESGKVGVLRTILRNDTTRVLKHLTLKASIKLPPVVFEVAFNGSSVPVSFVVFKDDALFSSKRLRQMRVNNSMSWDGTTGAPNAKTDMPPQAPTVTKVLGPVLSASVGGGLNIVNLTEAVELEFSVEEGLNYSNVECVFWDFDLDGGSGDWSNEGCQFAGQRSDGGIICHCNHLTNFAVLVDIHGQLQIDDKQKFALDLITRIGCFLSIAGLAFTILTFLLFKSLRSNRSRHILVHLCFALLALYIVFVCGIVATRMEYACVAVSALLHYLVLVTIMWMGVEARHMYIMLVKVFKSERSKFVLKAAVIAWGIPLVAVSISVGLSLDSYRNEKYCFLMPGHVMYYGLLLPIALILLHNTITFGLAIRNLLCTDLSRNSVNKTKKEQIISRLQNAVCMSVLLGLTWSFGFLAVGEATFAFRLLFCLFNSFQGFIIFALFCVRSKEVRSAWSSLSLIECNIRSQSYRVKEKSYQANSESAWNGPCEWGDAPGLDTYMNANKQRFSGSSDDSRIPTYSVTATTLNANNLVNGNTHLNGNAIMKNGNTLTNNLANGKNNVNSNTTVNGHNIGNGRKVMNGNVVNGKKPMNGNPHMNSNKLEIGSNLPNESSKTPDEV